MRKITIATMFACAGSILSCNKDDDTTPPTLRFSATTTKVNESDGTIEVQISANKTVPSDVQVSFELSGSAYLNGDYTLQTTSPITISSGTQTTNITLKIIDEHIIESPDDTVKINLTSIGANAKLSQTASELEHLVVIKDNDSTPADKLQMDLTWDLGVGNDIDQVNLNVYVATNVVIDNNTVTDADIFARGESSSGFETLWIKSTDADGEYYLVVSYAEGSEAVKFNLNLNGFGFTNNSVDGNFKSSDSGSAVFYGPLTKSGSEIGRLRPFRRIN